MAVSGSPIGKPPCTKARRLVFSVMWIPAGSYCNPFSTDRQFFNPLPVTCRASCFLQSIQYRFGGDRHVTHAHADRVVDRVGDRRRHHR